LPFPIRLPRKAAPMTDLAAPVLPEATAEQAPAPRLYRAARLADIDLVHRRLMEAIDTSEHYGPAFKAYEKARLTKDYLAGLIALDPFHIMIFLKPDGETAGFMVSGPELGALWLFWTYLFPENRRSSLAMKGMRAFIDHWDNGRFHKISTYTKPGNAVAEAVMKRHGYVHVATLEAHIFGEDYLLFEHKLTKRLPGYGGGVPMGLHHRLRFKIQRWLSRR
jgi:RimJ/RimL family protein N-acetyltransferase